MNRRIFLKVAIINTAALAVNAAVFPLPRILHAEESSTAGHIVNCGSCQEPRLSITIDDFNSLWVLKRQLLPFLKKHPEVKISAFPIGVNIPYLEEQIPGLWNDLLEAGHEIGYHSMYHADLSRASAEQLRSDLGKFNHTLAAALGDRNFRVRFGRAPYGGYGNGEAFLQVGEEMGVTWLLWSTVPAVMVKTIPLDHLAAISNGDIALFHVTGTDMYWLEKYVQECAKREIEMVSIADLVT
ncbi:MAG: polysaccharide deacetylase family protein [Anaerolineae bacterium]|nr:polysaccharide deacetylase family protein [Anaerolineae bacterium]